MTHLWRVSVLLATNEESRKVKLSGTRTEVPFIIRGTLSIFIENLKEEYTLTKTLKRTVLFELCGAWWKNNRFRWLGFTCSIFEY